MWSLARLREGPKRPKPGIHNCSTGLILSAVENSKFSAESLEKIPYQRVEISVLRPHVFNFSDGVDDGRMMFSTKASTDFRKGRMRQCFAQVHRHLARHG